jgi:lysophospholipase L1-like esterase
MTMLARSEDGPNDTERQAFNASIRSGWQTFADAVVDVDADPHFGPNFPSSIYCADQTHPNNTGYGIVAGLVATVVASL